MLSTDFLITSSITIFTAVFGSGVVNGALTRHYAKSDEKDLEHEALKYLMKDSLTRYLRELVDNGEASDADKQYAEDYHEIYEKFGWNGQLDVLMDKMRALPLEKGEK